MVGVHQHAVQTGGAAPGVDGLAVRGQDAPGVLDLGGGGGEDVVGDRDLARVDGPLAGEAQRGGPGRLPGVALYPLGGHVDEGYAFFDRQSRAI